MNSHQRTQPRHEQISALIPWYINGTIGQVDRRKVESHLSACAACREDARDERRIFQKIAAENRVGYVPGSSLKRLHRALDGIEAETPAPHAPPPLAAWQTRPSVPWQRSTPLRAASVALLAMAAGVFASSQWTSARSPAPHSDYHTVTTPLVHPPGEVVRAVFSPTTTLGELQVLLDECQLRIISGPTEAGVYSLAPTSSRPVDLSLALLRQHAAVRFAESRLPSTDGSAPR
ncbi:MAG: zf-HC2 domain-containing protein [Pseudomonadota bacterium]|nr:zf-HC2 domain-containing protein [Pseudomonadota bacterium]